MPCAGVADVVATRPLNDPALVLGAKPALPASTLKELISRAKASPGKFNYASSGPGTPDHMAGELFKSMAGVYLVHIPLRGSTVARTDVPGGKVAVSFDAVTSVAEQENSANVNAP